MKSLIIGMGIGQLYRNVLTELGSTIVTVDADANKKADFNDVVSAIASYGIFDTVHICTPNYTHFDLASRVAQSGCIVFVEKPGVKTSEEWKRLVDTFPATRFMMVKNNMWRDNIGELQILAERAKQVDIQWIRRNCIPNPGSWFTTRELAFGGVSRDLMPHLLSLYIAINPNWRTDSVNGQGALMQWQLKDIDSTEYGVVNYNGTYDVDDMCHIGFGNKWKCLANWRSMNIESSSINFVMPDNSTEQFKLGWCPESAYLNMIRDAYNNINNNDFWQDQLDKDIWIHGKIENL
jgi:hypothetical protein